MADDNGEFRVNTPGIATVGPQQGVTPVLIHDIIPPNYPDVGELGATITIFRPGELAPVVANVPIPQGAMLCYIPPEQAAQYRPALYAEIRRLQERQREEMKRRGEMGR